MQRQLETALRRNGATGADVRAEVVDVTDRAALDRAFDAAAKAYGRIDVVFANAGIGGGPGFSPSRASATPDGALGGISDERWDASIAITSPPCSGPSRPPCAT